MTTAAQHQPSDALVGERIAGRFRVERWLAEGGMGRVYLARQEALDRLVAIKLLHVQDPDDAASFQRRFANEAEVLGRLKHPNTVRVFDYGLHEGTPYIVMEYIDGPTLAERIGEGVPMGPARAIRLVRQLAAAVDEAHSYGVVHRDLKPANVLLTQTNEGEQAKVVDFGLAALVDTDDRGPNGRVLGTATWMAPEQIQGHVVDHRADVYALGVILYGLLTGERPFEAESTREMLHAHLTRAPVSFADRGIQLPRVLEWTVRACLRKAPGERIRSARDLVAALNHCELALGASRYHVLPRLEQGRVVLPPIVAERDAGFEGIVSPREGGRRGAWIALAAGIGIAAVLALAWWQPRTVEVRVPVPVMVEAEAPEVYHAPAGRAETRALPEPTPAAIAPTRPVGPRPARPRPVVAPVAPAVPRAMPANDLKDPFSDRR